MLKYRAKYAAIVAGASAPIYLVIQLIFGADARPSLVRALWFFLVVFLVCLAIKWERMDSPERATTEEPPPTQE